MNSSRETFKSHCRKNHHWSIATRFLSGGNRL
jgi:hypothetical protein